MLGFSCLPLACLPSTFTTLTRCRLIWAVKTGSAQNGASFYITAPDGTYAPALSHHHVPATLATQLHSRPLWSSKESTCRRLGLGSTTLPGRWYRTSRQHYDWVMSTGLRARPQCNWSYFVFLHFSLADNISSSSKDRANRSMLEESRGNWHTTGLPRTLPWRLRWCMMTEWLSEHRGASEQYWQQVSLWLGCWHSSYGALEKAAWARLSALGLEVK